MKGSQIPKQFAARVKNVADTGQSGLFQLGGRPTFTFGPPGESSPLVATGRRASQLRLPIRPSLNPQRRPISQSRLQPGVPVAYTPPGRKVAVRRGGPARRPI